MYYSKRLINHRLINPGVFRFLRKFLAIVKTDNYRLHYAHGARYYRQLRREIMALTGDNVFLLIGV